VCFSINFFIDLFPIKIDRHKLRNFVEKRNKFVKRGGDPTNFKATSDDEGQDEDYEAPPCVVS